MKVGTFIRLSLTIAFLVFMWMGYKWALYLNITLMAISNEIISLGIKLVAKKLKEGKL
jgi:hypothetical protein